MNVLFLAVAHIMLAIYLGMCILTLLSLGYVGNSTSFLDASLLIMLLCRFFYLFILVDKLMIVSQAGFIPWATFIINCLSISIGSR
jgi:hypothetical protein